MPNNNPQPQTINQIATELDDIITNFLKQKKLDHTGSVSISIHGVPFSKMADGTNCVMNTNKLGRSYLNYNLIAKYSTITIFSETIKDNETP